MENVVGFGDGAGEEHFRVGDILEKEPSRRTEEPSGSN